MSETGPEAKKQKKHHDFKKKFYNQLQNNRKHFLEPGQIGFLATCNFRERACVRECYNVLNHYADELYGPLVKKIQSDDHQQNEGTDVVNDIVDDLEKEIQDAKSERKPNKYRFQVVETGTTNCLFVKTSLPDPIPLGLTIVRDIAETKKQRSRHLLRLIPISVVARANLKDITDAAGKLFDQYFLKQPKTFSVIFNKRYNNDIKRDEIIKELAELVAAKNINNKVDLKNAEVSIIVEIIKGLCCLSVVPHYLKYKKYNLVELAAANDTDDKPKDKDNDSKSDSLSVEKSSPPETETTDTEDASEKSCANVATDD